MKSGWLAVVAGTLALTTGCATGPGPVEAQVAPRLVVMFRGAVGWNHPDRFGPVPPARREFAQRICGELDTPRHRYIPIGYHARALDRDGRPLPEGGVLCKKTRR